MTMDMVHDGLLVGGGNGNASGVREDAGDGDEDGGASGSANVEEKSPVHHLQNDICRDCGRGRYFDKRYPLDAREATAGAPNEAPMPLTAAVVAPGRRSSSPARCLTLTDYPTIYF